MIFHCTKVIFVMQYVSTMDGHCLTFQQSVSVVLHSLMIIPSLVLMVVPTLHQNEIRDITVQLMFEVCPNVTTLPTLLPVTHEHFHYSVNAESGARLDVRAQGFWGVHYQKAYVCLIL